MEKKGKTHKKKQGKSEKKNKEKKKTRIGGSGKIFSRGQAVPSRHLGKRAHEDQKTAHYRETKKCARTFFCTNLLNAPQGSRTYRQNSRDIPDSCLRNPRKTNFRGRGTNFSATTPSRGRPPPHRAVSGPKKVNLCALFFLAWTLRRGKQPILEVI